MNTYKVTFASGNKHTRQATDMRALLTVLELIEGKPEPVKIKLVDR